MESVVLKPLGNVNGLNTRSLLEGTCVDDEFVSATSSLVCVQNGVVALESCKEVVGVEKGNLRRLAQSLVACSQICCQSLFEWHSSCKHLPIVAI